MQLVFKILHYMNYVHEGCTIASFSTCNYARIINTVHAISAQGILSTEVLFFCSVIFLQVAAFIYMSVKAVDTVDQ